MKKVLLKIYFLLIFIINMYAMETDFTNDKHFAKLVKDFDILSIEYIEDVGKFAFDPIVKITMKDGRHFSIKHAFSKKPNKLMLYMLDDYEVEYGIDVNGKNIKHEFGIYFTDLEKYLDFKITGIEDIIIHYEKILEFIEYLDSCQDYIMYEDLKGYYTEYKKKDLSEPRYYKLDINKYLRLGVTDINDERIIKKVTSIVYKENGKYFIREKK